MKVARRATTPRSTARRLIVTLTAVMTGVLLTTCVVSIHLVQGFIQDRANSRLTDTSERIKALLGGLDGLVIDPTTLDSMARTGPAEVVLVRDGRPLLWVNGDADTASAVIAAAGSDGSPHEVPGHPNVVAIKVDTVNFSVRQGSGTVTPSSVVLATSLAPEAAAIRTITTMMVAGMLAAIAALILLTALIVGRGLQPLREMTERTHRYAQGERQTRLPVTGRDSDLTRLAATVNDAMDAQHRAEDRIRSFVADASHELRTPLTIASGWVELDVQGGLSDPESRERALRRVQTQLSRMRMLVDELALLARLDQGRPLELQPVVLGELVSDVVEDARVINPDRTFTVRAAGAATVRADEARLQQVLSNLLSNAVKHTPSGTPIEVTVRAARPGELADERMHTLLVTDHGPGIPAEDHQRVFERFWRGDTSRRRETGGFGLGLAIVASIVAAHGGLSDVISVPGQGTTVRIRLPRAVDRGGRTRV